MKANHFIKVFFIALIVGLFLTTGNILIPRAADPSTAYLYAPNEPDTTVTNVSPSPNSHTASLNTTLAITLSGAINEATVTNQSLVVHGGGHGHMDGTITFGSIYYDPSQDFFPGELVQTSVTAGVLDASNLPITPYVWQFRAAAGTGPGTFADSGQNMMIPGISDVELGDVDGDGDLDAVTGQFNQPNSVWLNDGLGNFTNSGQSLGTFATELALGDLDGDGDLDVFQIRANLPKKVWLNNGNGFFTDSGQNLGNAFSRTVDLGDVDGDGDLDAYVGNVNSQPDEVWLNDGLGNFTNSGQSLGNSVAYTVALGDLDGDGDLDAFVGNAQPQPNKVWLNDGSGTFTATSQNMTNASLEDLAIGDLDGDGDLDALIGNYYSPNQVWLNNGLGTFTNSGQSLENFITTAVGLGDFDGDSDLDAYVGNYGDPNVVLLNDGTGIFTPNGQHPVPSASGDFAIGDMDGDGDLDVFVANGSSQPSKIWLNTIPPFAVTFVDPPANSDTAPLAETLSITLSKEISETTVTTQTLFVHGGGHGQMDGAITFGSILYNPLDDFFPGEVVQASVTTGIKDASGSSLPIPYVWQFRAAAGVGPGGFSDSGQTLGLFDSREIALGDLDGDGDLDAFVGSYIPQPNQVWLNDGLGNFTNSGQNLGNGSTEAVALGDLDRDGDLDAFVGNYDGPNNLWLNDGTGTFTDSGQSLGNLDTTAVALGDLDGDGDLDAFEVNWNQPKLVWLNDGSGTFTDSGQNLGTSLSVAIALGDVDEDGDLDAFVGNLGQADKVWLNNGAGIFTDSGQSLGTATCAGVALGDVDGDSDLDAYVVNSAQPSRLWRNNGLGTFTDSGQSLGTTDAAAVVLGDLNGDGDLDAFVVNTVAPNQVWQNNGSGTFTNLGQSLGGSGSRTVALGDLDGDDDLDAFVGYWALEPDKVWLNEVPEIDVTGNGLSITNGDTTPSTSDGTAFGSTPTTGGTVSHIFTIHNTGEGNLSLAGTPAIVLTTGTHFTVTFQPASNLIASGNVITFEITFDPAATGTILDTVTIANNDLNENPYNFAISGIGLNTPPLAGNDTYTTPEDLSLMIAAPGVLGNDTDGDSDPLIAILDDEVSHGTMTLDSDGSFNYTPEANFCGEDSFTYHADDGTDPSGLATVSLSVTCVADVPLANNDSYETNEDTPLTISVPGVLGNDTDGDNDPLTALLDTNVSHGTLSLNSNGSFSYLPDPDYCGLDSFTYHAYDGQAPSNLATVSLTVTCVNDAPFSLAEAYTTTEDTPLLIAAPGVLANDTDVEDDPLNAVLDTGPTNGELSLNSDGGFTYTANANSCGADSFTYHAFDGQAASNLATVALTVTCVNDIPIAVSDLYTTTVDTPLAIAVPGVLANDTDVEGAPLTVTLVLDPLTGTLVLNPDGSFVYTPTLGYTGVVTFTYTASDGVDISEPVTVTIVVQPAPVTEFWLYLPIAIR